MGDVQWVIEDNQYIYYKTAMKASAEGESPYPPLSADDWFPHCGAEPCPTLRVIRGVGSAPAQAASPGTPPPASRRTHGPPNITASASSLTDTITTPTDNAFSDADGTTPRGLGRSGSDLSVGSVH